jgi:uncharacterized protein (TIGR02996 family)
MTDADAFLAAVAAEPDDDAPRLVFADWLDDRGDHDRAAFIRMQCAAACLSTNDPARVRLERQATGLLRRHGPIWSVGVPVADVTVEFRRGFVASVCLDLDGFLRSGPALLALRPAVRVDLEGVHEETAGLLAGLPWLAGLRSLGFRGPHAGSVAGLRVLLASPHLVGLRVLDCSGSDLGPEGAALLARSESLAGLEELDLSGCRLEDAGAEALAASPVLRRLRVLRLGPAAGETNAIGDGGVIALAAAPVLAGVHELDLSDNSFSIDGARALAESPQLGRLRVLRVTGNHLGFGPVGCLGVITSPSLPRLRELDLSDCVGYASIGDWPAVADWPHAPALARLALDRVPIGDEGAMVLAELPRLEGLSALSLRGCGIGDAGAASLAGSPHLTDLVDLWLSDNRLGDDGLRALGASPHLGRVRRLGLGGNPFSPAGVQALTGSGGGPASLTLLGLEKSRVGWPGAKALAGWPACGTLTALSLADTGIGAVGSAGLEEIFAAPHAARLRELNLSGNRLGVSAAQVIAAATNLAGLEELCLDDADLEDAGLRALSRAVHLTRLERLLLARNRFGPPGLVALLRASLPALRELDFSGNPLGDASAKALAAWPGLARLTALRLRRCKVGAEGARALAMADLRSLSRLDLEDNPVGSDAAGRLRDRLGDRVQVGW